MEVSIICSWFWKLQLQIWPLSQFRHMKLNVEGEIWLHLINWNWSNTIRYNFTSTTWGRKSSLTICKRIILFTVKNQDQVCDFNIRSYEHEKRTRILKIIKYFCFNLLLLFDKLYKLCSLIADIFILWVSIISMNKVFYHQIRYLGFNPSRTPKN